MKKAFTLAEIMIVLTIIGVLTAILLPIANHSRPDENVMKFKKADTTLKNVIRELVNSDKYYVDGDLGIRKLANGTSQLIDGSHSGDNTYFCNSVADMLSVKKVNCSDTIVTGFDNLRIDTVCGLNVGDKMQHGACAYTAKEGADIACKNNAGDIGNEIITSDNIVYYQSSAAPFGFILSNNYSSFEDCKEVQGETACKSRLFGGNMHNNQFNFDRIYKVFCIDVDGIPLNGSKNCDDVKDICPFGYGIRADGKIISGARADEWVEKGFQKGANDN